MATYKEIFGTNIEVLASDPANPVTGQVWYNSTDNVVKGAAATTAGAWATGTNIGSSRYLSGGAGTKTAALVFGGEGPTGDIGSTESWNGTSWTEVNDLNTARIGMANSIGTYTATLSAGGSPLSALNESWNGTSWTEVSDLNTGRQYFGGSGADNTSAIVFGGNSSGPTLQGATENWNGSSWTEVNDLNTARRNVVGAGKLHNAALAISGGTPPSSPVVANVENWNGTSWTEVNDVNTARGYGGASGTPSAALFYGGTTGSNTGATESWNGTSWTEDANLATARHGLSSAGTTNTAALASAGRTPVARSNNVEEWTGAGSPLIQTFTDS